MTNKITLICSHKGDYQINTVLLNYILSVYMTPNNTMIFSDGVKKCGNGSVAIEIDQDGDIESIILNTILIRDIGGEYVKSAACVGSPDFYISKLDSLVNNLQDEEKKVFILNPNVIKCWIEESNILDSIDYELVYLSRALGEIPDWVSNNNFVIPRLLDDGLVSYSVFKNILQQWLPIIESVKLQAIFSYKQNEEAPLESDGSNIEIGRPIIIQRQNAIVLGDNVVYSSDDEEDSRILLDSGTDDDTTTIAASIIISSELSGGLTGTESDDGEGYSDESSGKEKYSSDNSAAYTDIVELPEDTSASGESTTEEYYLGEDGSVARDLFGGGYYDNTNLAGAMEPPEEDNTLEDLY